MIALIQRVAEAHVDIDGKRVAAIDDGVLALIGVERDDAIAQANRLLQRILAYRIFPDTEGRMNLSVTDTCGGLLLVPQFTLAADTTKGNRPSFTSAGEPAKSQTLFEHMVEQARSRHARVGCGVFGADMRVGLVNDGPVTFWLHAR